MRRSIGLLAIAALLLSSCDVLQKTAKTVDTTSSIKNFTVADVKVAENRISKTIEPSKEIQRGGIENIKQAVEAAALAENGNADVLMDPQYVISKKRTLFGSKITSITVTGRPGFYTNYRSLNDTVWSNPAFRGVARPMVCRKATVPQEQSSLLAIPSKPEMRSMGLHAHIDFNGGYVKTKDDEDDLDVDESGHFFGSGSVTLGYQTTPHWFFGVGTGYEVIRLNHFEHQKLDFIPIFANARYYFSANPKSFFIDYKLGYAEEVAQGKCDGGMYTRLSLGYTWGNVDLSLHIGSQYFKYDDRHDKYTFNSSLYGINLGFRL